MTEMKNTKGPEMIRIALFCLPLPVFCFVSLQCQIFCSSGMLLTSNNEYDSFIHYPIQEI